MSSKVFISHGHDELTTHKLKDFVRDRLKLEPVILSEQPDRGLTIVEKLELYGKDCGFALILLTAEDETPSGTRRARQNVIHELGYFHGLLGRSRVLLLKEHGTELFSNISGLIYKEFPCGAVEAVFEEIRTAIESGDASMHGDSIPSQQGTESQDVLHEVVEECRETTRLIAPHARQDVLRQLASVPCSLPPQVRLQRVKRVLAGEYQRWQDRGSTARDEIRRTGHEPSDVLGKALTLAALEQMEHVERSLRSCLDILDACESAETGTLDWLDDAVAEVIQTLRE